MPDTDSSAVNAIGSRYPALAGIDASVATALAALPQLQVPAGTALFSVGQPCRGFPLLLEGCVRVSRNAESGRGIMLYRVRAGESCVITSSCLLGAADYSADGVVEQDTRLVVLPNALFERLVDQVPAFRRFVFELFAERLAQMMQLVEEVAFRRLDARLAALLLARSGQGTSVLRSSHQQLAEELGSVREIVTRLLGQFADEGLVVLARERIEVRDTTGLAARAV